MALQLELEREGLDRDEEKPDDPCDELEFASEFEVDYEVRYPFMV